MVKKASLIPVTVVTVWTDMNEKKNRIMFVRSVVCFVGCFNGHAVNYEHH